MADYVFRVTPEIVSDRAADMQVAAQKLEISLTEMKDTIKGLQSTFEGETAAALQAKIEALSGELLSAVAAAMEHVTDLQKAAENYRLAEAQGKDKVEPLPTDGDF